MSKNEFKNLKSLLLKPEQDKLQKLTDELNRLRKALTEKDQLISALQPVIAPLLEKNINESPDDIAAILAPIMGRAIEKQTAISQQEILRALSPLMGKAIKNQVSEAKEEIADALYPVIGQTIRKAIAEAMKKLARTVNERVDNALSFQKIKIKIKSRISGIPEDQLVLKEALPFNIHEMFYIHRESGILVTHVSDQNETRPADQEIISGMLTAIRDFAGSAFSDEYHRELNELQYDDMQIYLEVGRHAYLAVVVSGVPPEDFNQLLTKLEQGIHQSHSKELRSFDGNTDTFEDLQKRLAQFTTKLNRETVKIGKTAELKSHSRGLVYLFGIIIFIILILWTVFYLPGKIIANRINSQISQLAENAPLNDVNQLNWKWANNTLFIEGVTRNHEQKKNVSQFLASQLAVDNIENQIKILPSAPDIVETLRKLQAEIGGNLKTDLSNLQLIVGDERLIIKGNVFSPQERAIIIEALAQMTDASFIHSELICPQDFREWKNTVHQEIENTTIYYPSGETGFKEDDTLKLKLIVAHLKHLDFQQLMIKGFSDNTGDTSVNKQMSKMRAEFVRSYLISHNIHPDKLAVIAEGEKSPVASNDLPEGRAKNRRVTFLLKMD